MTGENHTFARLRPRGMNCPARGVTRFAVALPAAAALLLAACSESPLDPAAFAPEPCRVIPAAGSAVSVDPALAAGLAAALTDAATRLTLSLPTEDRGELQAALTQLATQTGADDADTACRSLLLARDVLNRLPDSPATLPDRHAMWLVLELATTSSAP